MIQRFKYNHTWILLAVGLVGWLVPGAGHFVLKETRRAIIIFATIVLTFCIGIYVGSIGVIDPIGAWPWYIAQVMNSPFVALIGHHSSGGGYPVYGKPHEIGQIYTSIAGLLNLMLPVSVFSA